MLSFEEFKAATDRDKAQKILKSDAGAGIKLDRPAPKASGNRSKKANDVRKRETGPTSFADIIEAHQTQIFMMFLIIFDTFCSFAEVFINGIDELSVVNRVFPFLRYQTVFAAVLKSVNGFCLSVFAIELLLTMLVFRLSIVGHIGYCVDIATVASQLYFELEGCGRETRLLNIFRFWRLVRLVNSLASIEARAHDNTKLELVSAVNEQNELKGVVSRLQLDVEKEREAKLAVETMLQGYKDEVDTLNEALKIAAMDIADVAQADDDLLESDDEDLGSVSEMESLRKGKADDIAGIIGDSGSNTSTTTTFLIHEDGSYDKT
jgi:hypothetical protein